MLRLSGYIELPKHVWPGGFDHADIHPASRRLYVAHTCNDALDVIDCNRAAYLHSIENLSGVAGALVSGDMVFTSNREENTVGVFPVGDERQLAKIPVGVRPNGLAFDPRRDLLLAANVGSPEIADSFTVSMLDVRRGHVVHTIPVPGRTRWAVYDGVSDCFYVNIADPALIIGIAAENPGVVARSFSMPASGPHGLDLDPQNRRLFCACDGRELITVILPEGEIHTASALSGAPDVILFHAALNRLYVAIGDPGLIDVFDTRDMTRIQSIDTEQGAHTLALDRQRDTIYAFLPQTHCAAVFIDDQE